MSAGPSGHLFFRLNIMQNDPNQGNAELPVPFFITLPPAANGYKRQLWRGPGLALLCERFESNRWHDHSHEPLQITVVISRSKYEFSWEMADGKWHRESHTGPSVMVVPENQPHAMVLPNGGDIVNLYL